MPSLRIEFCFVLWKREWKNKKSDVDLFYQNNNNDNINNVPKHQYRADESRDFIIIRITSFGAVAQFKPQEVAWGINTLQERLLSVG